MWPVKAYKVRIGSLSLQLNVVVLFCMGFDLSITIDKPPVSSDVAVKSHYMLHRHKRFLNALR